MPAACRALHQSGDDLVVHGAAEQGMGVANHGIVRRRLKRSFGNRLQRAGRPCNRESLECSGPRGHSMPARSTSNTSVAPGGMTPPAPLSPYARCGWNRQAPPPAHSHAEHSLVPTLDHLAGADHEAERLAAAARTVEFLALLVGRRRFVQPARVLHHGLLAGGYRGARTRLAGRVSAGNPPWPPASGRAGCAGCRRMPPKRPSSTPPGICRFAGMPWRHMLKDLAACVGGHSSAKRGASSVSRES